MNKLERDKLREIANNNGRWSNEHKAYVFLDLEPQDLISILDYMDHLEDALKNVRHHIDHAHPTYSNYTVAIGLIDQALEGNGDD